MLVVLKDRALQDTKLALEAANNTIANLRISIRFVRAQLAGPLSRLPAAYVGVQPRSLGSIQDGLHVFWNSDLDLSADGIATLHDFDGFHVALPFILSDLPNCKVSLFCSGDDVISIDLFGAEPTKRPFFVTGVRHLHNLHPGEADVCFALKVRTPWENQSILHLHGSFRLPNNHPVIGNDPFQTQSNITGFSVQEVTPRIPSGLVWDR
ncbi:expressed unknown protein [Seminavis robusta]|uniref:Uncharacterized protein n=1 Tax=Seminavis robusta TaxID=568900 RepID=A0A9N8EAN6_9STRA|nr:expressed unknown protein [Seminavis robusta]|eukprot:Sro735_g194910.1 n/a (209) ;mRNA; f:31104-31730